MAEKEVKYFKYSTYEKTAAGNKHLTGKYWHVYRGYDFFEKTIEYYPDSTLKSISFDGQEYAKNRWLYYSLSTDPEDAEFDFGMKTYSTQLGAEVEISLYLFNGYLDHSESYVTLYFSNPYRQYTRTYAVSDELITFYKEYVLEQVSSDANPFEQYAPIPPLNSCTELREVQYKVHNRLIDSEYNERTYYLDSIYSPETNSWGVTENEIFRYYQENRDGTAIEKIKRGSEIIQTHYTADNYPSYFSLCRFGFTGSDTVLWIEYDVEKKGNKYLQQIYVNHFVKEAKDKPATISERWIDLTWKRNLIVRQDARAITNYDFELRHLKGSAVPKKKRIDQRTKSPTSRKKYDLLPDNIMLIIALKIPQKRKSYKVPDFNKNELKRIREGTELVEKDRKTGIEKRIAIDVYSEVVYEVVFDVE